jgi:hypothetical protein
MAGWPTGLVRAGPRELLLLLKDDLCFLAARIEAVKRMQTDVSLEEAVKSEINPGAQILVRESADTENGAAAEVVA